MVNRQDEFLGYGDKLLVHIQGRLHRAFSVIIFNSQGEMLLQQRAWTKYHSPGLWTNTCCSHPLGQESLHEAAKRRLPEEMGLHCQLTSIGSFIYECALDDHLFEHELDHILVGVTDEIPVPNPQEVAAFHYTTFEQLEIELNQNPAQFTFWFQEMNSQGLLKRAFQFIQTMI